MTSLLFLLAAASIGYALAQVVLRRESSPGRAERRALVQAPRRTIGDYPDGEEGRFVGSVRLFHGEAAPAPLTGRLCVAWVLRVYRHRQDNRKARRDWIHEEAGCVPFMLEDRTGRCLVGTGETRLDLEVDTTDMAPSGQIQRYLRANPGLERAGALIFEEARLEAGDAVAVIGAGRWEPDEDPQPQGYRDAGDGRKRLVLGDALLADDPSCFS